MATLFMNIDGKVALITGSAKRVGKEIALEFGRRGARLAIHYRSSSEEDAKAVAGKDGAVFQADLKESTAVETMFRQIEAKFGGLDILVNSASVFGPATADEATPEHWDLQMDTNAKAPFFLTQLAARWMIEQTRNQPPVNARIVTITSLSAYAASINRAEYCVSKAALSMLTPLFAARLAEHGIQVFEIRPGIIATDMTKGMPEKILAGMVERTPVGRIGQPDDIAPIAVFLASDDSKWLTGETILAGGGSR